VPEKYEREIEEILRRMSYPTQSRRRRSAGWLGDLSTIWRRYTSDVSPSQLLVLGIALAFFGYFVRAFIPALGFPLSLLALACLVGGLALSMRQRNSQRPSVWRGETIDLSNGDWWSNLKQRWDDWRRRHG
jgi:hypothetical protein